MMTVQELTKNEKYKFWYFKIKECKESGLSVESAKYTILFGAYIKNNITKTFGHKKRNTQLFYMDK